MGFSNYLFFFFFVYKTSVFQPLTSSHVLLHHHGRGSSCHHAGPPSGWIRHGDAGYCRWHHLGHHCCPTGHSSCLDTTYSRFQPQSKWYDHYLPAGAPSRPWGKNGISPLVHFDIWSCDRQDSIKNPIEKVGVFVFSTILTSRTSTRTSFWANRKWWHWIQLPWRHTVSVFAGLSDLPGRHVHPLQPDCHLLTDADRLRSVLHRRCCTLKTSNCDCKPPDLWPSEWLCYCFSLWCLVPWPWWLVIVLHHHTWAPFQIHQFFGEVWWSQAVVVFGLRVSSWSFRSGRLSCPTCWAWWSVSGVWPTSAGCWLVGRSPYRSVTSAAWRLSLTACTESGIWM